MKIQKLKSTALILVVLSTVLGCNQYGTDLDSWVTPAGCVVYQYHDHGSVASGFTTRDNISSSCDARVVSWVEAREADSGRTGADLWNIARSVEYIIIDAWYFEYPNDNGYTQIYGMNDPNTMRVWACLWSGGYQQLPLDGLMLPVIPWELDHIAGFREHD